MRAFKTDDLPRLTMPKAAISIVDSSSLRPRSRNCESSLGQHGFFLGRQFQAGEGRFEAVLGALDRFVFVGDLTFQLAKQFVELGVGHEMSLSLTRRSDRLFAPLGHIASRS